MVRTCFITPPHCGQTGTLGSGFGMRRLCTATRAAVQFRKATECRGSREHQRFDLAQGDWREDHASWPCPGDTLGKGVRFLSALADQHGHSAEPIDGYCSA
jgi:hypothetical protein